MPDLSELSPEEKDELILWLYAEVVINWPPDHVVDGDKLDEVAHIIRAYRAMKAKAEEITHEDGHRRVTAAKDILAAGKEAEKP